MGETGDSMSGSRRISREGADSSAVCVVGGDEQPDHVLRAMLGAKIEYIVTAVDREGGCAVASREAASVRNRRHAMQELALKTGDRISCDVLAVGAARLRASAHGYDFQIGRQDLSYDYLGDLRELYHPGQELFAEITEIDEERMQVSVKRAMPNPYDGAQMRHPVGCRRIAKIVGKYAGGVFCRLSDGCTVVCGYAQQFQDSQFALGDRVVVQIAGHHRERSWLRGTIRGRG